MILSMEKAVVTRVVTKFTLNLYLAYQDGKNFPETRFTFIVLSHTIKQWETLVLLDTMNISATEVGSWFFMRRCNKQQDVRKHKNSLILIVFIGFKTRTKL